MNARNQCKEIDKTEEQILLSLEFLLREAKKNNSYELYEILNSAIFLAREHNTDLDYLIELFGNNDELTASMLLVKFLKSENNNKEYLSAKAVSMTNDN